MLSKPAARPSPQGWCPQRANPQRRTHGTRRRSMYGQTGLHWGIGCAWRNPAQESIALYGQTGLQASIATFKTSDKTTNLLSKVIEPGGLRRLKNRGSDLPKSRPGALKIESVALQDAICNNFEILKLQTDHQGQFLRPTCSKLEFQNPPESRPKPAKIDVKKRCIFAIDFGMVRTSFRKGFREVFRMFFQRHAPRQVHIADMLVIQENHSIC